MPPDERRDAFAHDAALLIGDLLMAVARRDNQGIAAAMTALLHAAIAFTETLGERPDDEPLRRALERLKA